jgi:hypothetical protein
MDRLVSAFRAANLLPPNEIDGFSPVRGLMKVYPRNDAELAPAGTT